MPDLSSCVKVSKDGRYILATGIYKPRVRCFEVDNLSMKFERCMDSEVVAFEILSDDYSKVSMLCFNQTLVLSKKNKIDILLVAASFSSK